MTSNQDASRTRGVISTGLLVIVVATAVAGWVLATRASTVGELLSSWLPAMIVAIVLFIGAAMARRNPDLPKVIGPLAALALVVLLVRGVAEFVWIWTGQG